MSAVIHQLKVAPHSQEQGAAAPEPRRSRARKWFAFVAHEPFFQFMLLGLLIWSGVEFWKAHNDHFTIHIGPAERQRIAMNYSRQFGQMPTAQQLEGMLDHYVREEIYWREGLALNLDKDDEIVRRRIVQKYEFLQTDLAVADTPTTVVLQRWFEQNKQRYLTPERVAFSHVYFSVDHEGEQAAKERAVKALEKLRATHTTRAVELGDAFPGPTDLSSLAPDESARLFGESELSQTLFKAPVDQWSGPYRSGYGWHLVHVTGHMPASLPPFAQVQERVLEDYREDQRRLLNARAFEKVRAKYTVRYDGAGQAVVATKANVSLEPAGME